MRTTTETPALYRAGVYFWRPAAWEHAPGHSKVYLYRTYHSGKFVQFDGVYTDSWEDFVRLLASWNENTTGWSYLELRQD